MRNSHSYTAEEEQIIRKYYPTHRTEDVAKMIGVSKYSCYNKARSMGVSKDPAFLKEQNIRLGMAMMKKLEKYQFKKGFEPPNKGKKISEEVREKIKHTWFKPGREPHNTKYDGAESVRICKNGVKVIFVRVSKNVWVPKQILVWEKVNGKVPKGYNIVFKDGNTLNTNLDNLEMLSDGELMERNSFINKYTPEIREMIRMKAVLKRMINKTTEEHGDTY